jgi:hypothetical protein
MSSNDRDTRAILLAKAVANVHRDDLAWTIPARLSFGAA